MTDKEKQIAEMANILCENCLSVDGETKCRYLVDNSLTNKTFYRACRSARLSEATKLCEQGYRKIPEGAVVLSKEEYESLLKGVHTTSYTAIT